MGGKLKLLEIVTVTFVVFISLGIIKYLNNYSSTEAEFKEFKPRFKFKSRFKYGWFHLNFY